MGLVVSAMPRVLLGGGIGAGKSTIADVFAERGFSIIESDRVAAEMMRPGSATSLAVARRWPSVVSDGAVDRGALAQIVFADPAELRQLEAITHPAVADEIARLVSSDPGAVLVEVPLLHLELKGDWYKIAVVADVEVRIARVVARGGVAADIRQRIASQVSDDQWIEWGDFVIENSGPWAETLKATESVVEACA